jgi:hypothetical protein
MCLTTLRQPVHWRVVVAAERPAICILGGVEGIMRLTSRTRRATEPTRAYQRVSTVKSDKLW